MLSDLDHPVGVMGSSDRPRTITLQSSKSEGRFRNLLLFLGGSILQILLEFFYVIFVFFLKKNWI